MTEQVRKGYRGHRKATWGVVAAFVVVLAAAVTPFATGAPPKEYSLTVSPPPPEVCFTGAGQPQEFVLTLKNERSNTTLGSAEITAPSFITLDPQTLTGAPPGSDNDERVIKLRNLTLTQAGLPIRITVAAKIQSSGDEPWDSVAKQSNNFADAPGPGNRFSLKGDIPRLKVSECNYEYFFVEHPVDAEIDAPQDVEVQLRLDGQPVQRDGTLTLEALQDGDDLELDSDYFDGLVSGVQDANLTWNFSVTGKVIGSGYALRAPDGTISGTDLKRTFSIVAGLCPPGSADPNDDNDDHLASRCSLTSTLNGGVFESGVTINNHALNSPIAINFAYGKTATINGAYKCSGWSPALLTQDGEPLFPGVELDLSWAGTASNAKPLQVIFRVRNSEWVLTDAARGNKDVEICAGARHGLDPSKNGDGIAPFTDKFGKPAIWNVADGLYWGVLPTVQNPAKVKPDGDPAVCARGTQDLLTGNDGATLETWRTWTICIPSDWDWKNFG